MTRTEKAQKIVADYATDKAAIHLADAIKALQKASDVFAQNALDHSMLKTGLDGEPIRRVMDDICEDVQDVIGTVTALQNSMRPAYCPHWTNGGTSKPVDATELPTILRKYPHLNLD